MPDRLESGTPNTPGICGLRAGMEWVSAHGIDNICRKETQQMALAYDLLSTVPGIRLYTARPQIGQCAPVLSLNLKGHCSEELAVELNRYSVAVRAGLHCAPSAHRAYGTAPAGTARLAPSIYTSRQEIEQACRVIRKCATTTHWGGGAQS